MEIYIYLHICKSMCMDVEEEESFMCELSIKVPIRKKSGNLFNDPLMSKIWC